MTPAQQRLVMAARQRRAQEYEREYADWRSANGMAPARNPWEDEANWRPAAARQLAMIVAVAAVGCGVVASLIVIFTWLLGRVM